MTQIATRLFWSGGWLDRLRLWSGLILFTFVLTHFLNHALGLVSLDAMEAAQNLRVAVTRSLIGAFLIKTSLVGHSLIALWMLTRLGTLRMPWARAAQSALGFTIPLLLMPHLFAAGIRSGALDDYGRYPAVLEDIRSRGFEWQILLLLIVWAHGCMGLHFWLRGEPWYRRMSHVLAGLAALIPAAAIAGAAEAAREAANLVLPPNTPLHDVLQARAHVATLASAALILLALGWLALRHLIRRRPIVFDVLYENGAIAKATSGPTLLEISHANRIPHVSACGGKARCSTCRVRVIAGGESLAAPEEAELRLLKRIGAPEGVRLACQVRPSAALTVARILDPSVERPYFDDHGAAGAIGVAAVMFVDIRGFTRLSESKLAFDVVFILNSFFAAAARAIEAHGGRVDKYIGDGVMAVFELKDGLGASARAALNAVVELDAELAKVNARLEGEMSEPLRLGIGLHAGRVVLGRVGSGPAAAPTVIGRIVNQASRLESLAKSRDALLAVSRACGDAAGLPMALCAVEQVELRGLDAPFDVVLVRSAADLALALREARPEVTV